MAEHRPRTGNPSLLRSAPKASAGRFSLGLTFEDADGGKNGRRSASSTHVGGDTIGEGSCVQNALYLLENHFGGSESVNCGRTKRQDIDIHLVLVKDRPWILDLKNRGPIECAS